MGKNLTKVEDNNFNTYTKMIKYIRNLKMLDVHKREVTQKLYNMYTNLSKKEKLFCIIAYLPKATVQSAKASIPLQMGVVGGDIMQAIAILSVLITAPIGAIGINLTCEPAYQVRNV